MIAGTVIHQQGMMMTMYQMETVKLDMAMSGVPLKMVKLLTVMYWRVRKEVKRRP